MYKLVYKGVHDRLVVEEMVEQLFFLRILNNIFVEKYSNTHTE